MILCTKSAIEEAIAIAPIIIPTIHLISRVSIACSSALNSAKSALVARCS